MLDNQQAEELKRKMREESDDQVDRRRELEKIGHALEEKRKEIGQLDAKKEKLTQEISKADLKFREDEQKLRDLQEEAAKILREHKQ